MATALASVLIGLFPGSAFADTYTGKISIIQINDTGSMDFRVFLNVPMANCSLNFGFVDRTSGLFNAYIAGLSTAYSLNKTVILQVTREASGFCRIYFAQY